MEPCVRPHVPPSATPGLAPFPLHILAPFPTPGPAPVPLHPIHHSRVWLHSTRPPHGPPTPWPAPHVPPLPPLGVWPCSTFLHSPTALGPASLPPTRWSRSGPALPLSSPATPGPAPLYPLSPPAAQGPVSLYPLPPPLRVWPRSTHLSKILPFTPTFIIWAGKAKATGSDVSLIALLCIVGDRHWHALTRQT